MLRYLETPIQQIFDSSLAQAGVKLLIKREDLNHPFVSGNKWWKLKYNLEEAIRQNYQTVLTYGGAYSNHIFATAAAAAELGLKSVGIIRGEQTLPMNAVLSFAKTQGMQLHHISRDAYRAKSLSDNYLKQFGNFYGIPEGGSNLLAVKGVQEFASILDIHYDYICCAVGTGGTLSGLIEGVPEHKRVIGFPVLKGAEFLIDEIKELSEKSRHRSNWQLKFDYHFGGYGKKTPQLMKFIMDFKTNNNIPLDFIYTAKMMCGVYNLISKGFFERGSTILAIHTGGLQTANAS